MAVEVKPKERQTQMPLGKDALAAAYFAGGEAISDHSGYHLELISPANVLGKSVTVRLLVPQTKERRARGHRRYSAELVHWTSLLTRTTDAEVTRWRM